MQSRRPAIPALLVVAAVAACHDSSAGVQYACAQGWGIFDGPSDSASVRAIASWRANVLRLPLNETCWLGINGVPAAYSGASYQKAIADFVALLNRNGLVVIR